MICGIHDAGATCLKGEVRSVIFGNHIYNWSVRRPKPCCMKAVIWRSLLTDVLVGMRVHRIAGERAATANGRV